MNVKKIAAVCKRAGEIRMLKAEGKTFAGTGAALYELPAELPLWALMLKWDADSPVSFKADGHTVHDYDERFRLEDEGLIPENRPFRWSVLNETQLTAE